MRPWFWDHGSIARNDVILWMFPYILDMDLVLQTMTYRPQKKNMHS